MSQHNDAHAAPNNDAHAAPNNDVDAGPKNKAETLLVQQRYREFCKQLFYWVNSLPERSVESHRSDDGRRHIVVTVQSPTKAFIKWQLYIDTNYSIFRIVKIVYEEPLPAYDDWRVAVRNDGRACVVFQTELQVSDSFRFTPSDQLIRMQKSYCYQMAFVFGQPCNSHDEPCNLHFRNVCLTTDMESGAKISQVMEVGCFSVPQQAAQQTIDGRINAKQPVQHNAYNEYAQ